MNITKKLLEDKFRDDVAAAANFVNNELFILSKMKMNKPEKPILPADHNPADARKYADELESYELHMTHYRASESSYNNTCTNYKAALHDYIVEASGIKQVVPEQYVGPVLAKAWQDGHSGGYYEYYLHILGLMEIFSTRKI